MNSQLLAAPKSNVGGSTLNPQPVLPGLGDLVKPFKFNAQPYEYKVVPLRECPTPQNLQLCDTPEAAAAYWRLHVPSNPYFNPECECFTVLLLNTRRRVKAHQIVSFGTHDTILVHPLTVFRLAVITSAAAVVLMHNHLRRPMPPIHNFGWLSDYDILCATPPATVVRSLREFLRETNPAQLRSWDQTIPIVQRETGKTLSALDAASKFSAILEHELPREGGRRPDVISLQNGVVIVLEFKEHGSPLPPHLDQTSAYARDIKNYHEKSHTLDVVPVLIPQAYKGERQQINSVHVLPPAQLGDFLLEQARRNTGTVIDPQAWINSEYAPLPSLVRAARMLFNREPLPRIKRAQSARVPEVVDLILSICHEAAATESRHLVLLTGAPGSGKTLVGLQLAHSAKLEDLRVKRPGKQGGAPAVFLSGNGPLVEVLQDALQNRAFVAGMKKFIDYYGFKRPDVIPSEHVLIFDEAQRAWDTHHMAAKHGTAISEPEKLLEIASRIPKWSVVIALVGEGQEIHKGEEAGLAGWQTALAKVQNPAACTIHGPPHALDLSREDRVRGCRIGNRCVGVATFLPAVLQRP